MKVFPVDSDISYSCSPQPQRQKRPRASGAAVHSADGRGRHEENGTANDAIGLDDDTDEEVQPIAGKAGSRKSRKALLSDSPSASVSAGHQKGSDVVQLGSDSDEDFQPELQPKGAQKRRRAAASAAGEQRNGTAPVPRRNARRQAASKAANGAADASAAVEFFMPLAQKKQKKAADKVAAQKAAAESAAKAAIEREAEERAAAEDARRKAAEAAATTFQQQLKQSAEDTAKINAGRAPHSFFARRATQVDAGAAKVKVVTELTTPPLPPLHVTQIPAGSFSYSTPETATFRLEPAASAVSAAESGALFSTPVSTAGEGSFALCAAQRVPRLPSGSQPAKQPPGSLLEALAKQLADAERPSDGSSAAELEDYPSPEQHLQRLRERLAQVSAARDAAAHDPGPAAASEAGAAPLPGPASMHALWTERFQPRQPAQVCGNAAAVAELRSWLAAWQENAAKAEAAEPSRHARRSHARALLSDSDWTAGDAGDDDSDDDAWGGTGVDRGNAVLLAGPVGCGKTAAAYAVALAAGYRVIEVNPSVNRAGAQVQRLVGEATQSQRVALAGPAAAATDVADGTASTEHAAAVAPVAEEPSKKAAASSFFQPRKQPGGSGKPPSGAVAKADKGSGRGNLPAPAEVAPQPVPGAKVAATAASAAADSKQAAANGKQAAAPPPLTLLLFEEVDNLQEEDRGFIATLQELLATSRCPIIMTSNHTSPSGLLGNLPARTISFVRPSTDEIVEQLVVMHEADAAPPTSLQHLQHLAHACSGDIRQSILMAQMLRGCTHPGAFAAAAAPPLEDSSLVAQELDHRLQLLSQRDLDAAEQLQASVLVAAADMLQHRVGAAPSGRGDSSMLHPRSREARLGSASSQQHRYRAACASWVEAADEALSESVRELACHVRDHRYERLAALRSIAGVQKVLRNTPGGGGGRTRGRGHRNYFEDALALAASAAAELTNGCPSFSAAP